jgi:enterobactin synthetase component D
MTFAPFLCDFHGCGFVERTFQVDASTLHQLQRLYALPDQLHRAVLKRQVEFLAGRVCAQHVIEALTGQKPATIPLQASRAPGWPPGIVGSITHTTNYAAALVGSATYYQGLGLDCEVVLSADKLNLQKHICVPHELETLHEAHDQWPPENLLTLIFSAKESLFKCLYPQVQAFFGFSAARVVGLDSAQHTFVMQLEQDLTPNLRRWSQWTGYFKRQDHLLMTAILYAMP